MKVLRSLLLLVCFARPTLVSPQSEVNAASLRESPVTRKLALPMRFEVNRGQAQSGVDFLAAAANYSVSLKAGRATLRLGHGSRSNGLSEPDAAEFSVELLGANLSPVSEPEQRLVGHSNYLFGPDANKWITGVAQYAKVRYTNIYPGVDVVYYGNQDRLEHDFVVHPRADVGQIRLAFSGVQRSELNRNGELVLHVSGGELCLKRPRAYQIIRRREVDVPTEYILQNRQASFRVGHRDPNRTLIIDPVLVYSTFLGGPPSSAGSSQGARAIAVDGTGDVYVAGFTTSTNFQVTPGGLSSTPAPIPQYAGFVSKLDSTGANLLYSTYVSGLFPNALLVDSSGNVYLLGGRVEWSALPIPNGSTSFQASPKGNNICILKLNATGDAVLYGTYLGGSTLEYPGGIVLDAAGNLYVSGTTASSDFPIVNPIQATIGLSKQNAFVSELNATGSALLFSTYLGLDSFSSADGIAVDAAGKIYVVGSTTPGFTLGFPTTPDAFQSTCDASKYDAFLMKLMTNPSSLLYSTCLGGAGDETGRAVAVDAAGNAYVAGSSSSSDFPVLRPLQPCGLNSGFVAGFDSANTLTFATCLGSDIANLAVDLFGNAFVSGGDSTEALPLRNPIDSVNASSQTAGQGFISEVDLSGRLLFSTFFGRGSGVVGPIAVDSVGNIYAAGGSGVEQQVIGFSPEPPKIDFFPVFNAFQPFFGSSTTCEHAGVYTSSPIYCVYSDAVIVKISPQSGAAAAVSPGEVQFLDAQQVGTASAPQNLTILDLGTAPLTISNVMVSGDFSIPTSPCPVAVAASGGNCTIPVTFTPTSLGTRNGSVTLTDNSPGSPRTILVVGQGASLGLTVAPGAPSSATVKAGSSASYSLSIGGAGTGGTASFSCGGAPRGALCSVPDTALVSATDASTFNVSVTTTPPTAGLHPSGFASSPWLWALALIGYVVLPGRVGPNRSRRLCLFLVPSLVLLCCCGGSSTSPKSSSGTQAGTYTLTVTAQSGSITQSTNLTLTVQ